MRCEDGMPDIPERLARAEVKLETALAGVANFRQFQTDARAFFTRHDAREEAAEETEAKRHQQNQDKIDASNAKMNIVLAMAAIVTLIVMGVGVYVSVQVSKHSEIIPQKVLGSQNAGPDLSSMQPQESRLPSMR